MNTDTRPIAPVRESSRRVLLEALTVGALLLVVGSLFFHLREAPLTEVEIAGYATRLSGRTASQRYNVRRAAEALNGKTIPPQGVFSFNRVVRSWSQDQGFVKAPVSFDGELIRAYGGGVCQASTTLYNVALLAGIPILERHPHVFAPHYVPPGQDAAVAQETIDLRFRNPYPWPLHIRALAQGDRLDIRLYGAQRPDTHVQVVADILSSTQPERLTRVVLRPASTAGRVYVRNPGLAGVRVVTYRIVSRRGEETRRERLADDTYQAMNHITQINEETAL